MKKIENAAWIHCGGAELYREKFIAGASYVFDEMASEDAVTVEQATAKQIGGGR